MTDLVRAKEAFDAANRELEAAKAKRNDALAMLNLARLSALQDRVSQMQAQETDDNK